MNIKAKAKINLTLDIVGKRPDGYHNVNMIMQTIELCDIIKVEKIFSGIEIGSTEPSPCVRIPYDETNLAYKAAKLFFDVSSVKGGARIRIAKHIPVCAGMAGGSADAAAVLVALNNLYGKPLSKKVLIKISSRLGADVPYCIVKGTALATGIGDVITPIKPLKRTCVLVVKPPIAISTPWAYKSLNFDTMHHPDTAAAAAAVESGDSQALYKLMGNAFEQTVFEHYPEIADIKARMYALGADAALMSGSGSTVFAFFENEKNAQNAFEEFNKEYRETFLTYTTNE